MTCFTFSSAVAVSFKVAPQVISLWNFNKHKGWKWYRYLWLRNGWTVNPVFFFDVFLDHEELETMFHEYAECRFQWHFRHWLFKQQPPFNHQLRAIFLQWCKHKRRKVAKWGTPTCDVEYLASLHPITEDYWQGRLADGEETVGEWCLFVFLEIMWHLLTKHWSHKSVSECLHKD